MLLLFLFAGRCQAAGRSANVLESQSVSNTSLRVVGATKNASTPHFHLLLIPILINQCLIIYRGKRVGKDYPPDLLGLLQSQLSCQVPAGDSASLTFISTFLDTVLICTYSRGKVTDLPRHRGVGLYRTETELQTLQLSYDN